MSREYHDGSVLITDLVIIITSCDWVISVFLFSVFSYNNNNNNNNIIYIALYTKVLKRFTIEGGTGIIKTYIT